MFCCQNPVKNSAGIVLGRLCFVCAVPAGDSRGWAAPASLPCDCPVPVGYSAGIWSQSSPGRLQHPSLLDLLQHRFRAANGAN